MPTPGKFINRSIDMYNNVIVPIFNECKPLMNEKIINIVNEIVASVKKVYSIILEKHKNHDSVSKFNLYDDDTRLEFQFNSEYGSIICNEYNSDGDIEYGLTYNDRRTDTRIHLFMSINNNEFMHVLYRPGKYIAYSISIDQEENCIRMNEI